MAEEKKKNGTAQTINVAVQDNGCEVKSTIEVREEIVAGLSARQMRIALLFVVRGAELDNALDFAKLYPRE